MVGISQGMILLTYVSECWTWVEVGLSIPHPRWRHLLLFTSCQYIAGELKAIGIHGDVSRQVCMGCKTELSMQYVIMLRFFSRLKQL